MTCEILFSRKNISKCCLLNFLSSMQSAKYTALWVISNKKKSSTKCKMCKLRSLCAFTKSHYNHCCLVQATLQEAHGPRVAHLSDIATADMQMLCNIFPILSSQLMKRSSFKQFFILKKKIYGMPVNWAWSFEQTLNGSQLRFTNGMILAVFDLRVTPILPTKFRVNWPFSSGEEAKNRFSRWLPWRPSWISDWHDFSYFWSTSNPNVSYEVWSQLAFRCRRRS